MTGRESRPESTGVAALDHGGDPLDATVAFDLLSDEIRIGIVRELAQHEGLTFSQLRERVGTADSGRFNYHLERLRGRLVEKTDGGYELTPVGAELASVLEGRDLQ